MPDSSIPKRRKHPRFKDFTKTEVRASTTYAELQTTSNFSFLRGASHPEELVTYAEKLNYKALAITDYHSLAGVVRAHIVAKKLGFQLIIGSRVLLHKQISDAWNNEPPLFELLLYASSKDSYQNLSSLLTLGKRRAPKGACYLCLEDILGHERELLAILPASINNCYLPENILSQLKEIFTGDRLSLAVSRIYGSLDKKINEKSIELHRRFELPLVATNDVHYHAARRKKLQDVVSCIRRGDNIETAGKKLFPNAERYLKPPEEMRRLFRELPQAIKRTAEIAERVKGFSLDDLKYQYPKEICPAGQTPIDYLTELTWSGAKEKYPQGVPEKVTKLIKHELQLIEELKYAQYFLTVYDIVAFAKGEKILCQGRGAAANSAVCYCLSITAVDPNRIDMLFERFVSKERDEPPDIDIDFEHERREEVIQYIYNKYGRNRAALTAVVTTYRGRSAVRDVGKALGLSLDCVDKLAKSLNRWSGRALSEEHVSAIGLDPADHRIALAIELSQEIMGFPRHLSQHVGGFIITEEPLSQMAPIENAAMEDRTVIEWDKDDIDAMGMLKIDILALGMLSCIRKTFAVINQSSSKKLNAELLQLATIPAEDEKVYDMICRADTVGVFQIESRAQMSMLPRLKPRRFYDLVIEVAIVRPGPIQGNMVHPYLRRRSGKEAVSYPNNEIKEILKRTLGIPLFQEQAMKVAIVAAGFSPGEADQLRRSFSAWKSQSNTVVERFGKRIIEGMTENGYSKGFIKLFFEQLKGFAEYGFPESHAASFALLAYVSSWLKCHYPAPFAASLINSQPMGFYLPSQIIQDAERHGVRILAIDVNFSDWDCTIEKNISTLRLGMRLIRGIAKSEALLIEEARRKNKMFSSIKQFWLLSGIKSSTLRALAKADAFNSMGIGRQRALWDAKKFKDSPLPLLDLIKEEHSEASLPKLSDAIQVFQDYQSTGLSIKAHPVSFLRASLEKHNIKPNVLLSNPKETPTGRRAAICGLVLVRQSPHTAGGVVFVTIEDETGTANLIVRAKTWEKYSSIAHSSVFLFARGRVERADGVVHLLVEELADATSLFTALPICSRDFH